MASSRPVPDGGWGWFVVAASFLVNVLMDGVRYSFGLLYIEFLNYFHESRGAVGWISGIMFGLLLLAAPIAGGLLNKFGCRPVMIGGSCTVSLGFFLGVFAMNVPYLCVTVGIISGFGFSMMFITFYVALVQYFDRRRSFAIGLAVLGSGLGGFAFNPLTNWLLSMYAWRGTLLILSGLLLNGVVCGAVMRPLHDTKLSTSKEQNISSSSELIPKEPQSCSYKTTNGNSNEISIEQKPFCDQPNAFKEMSKRPRYKVVRSFLSDIFRFSLLKNRTFLLFVVVEVAINISFMVPFIYIPDMCLLNIDDITRTEIVWLANAMSLANAGSRIPVGVFVDKYKRRINTTTVMAVLITVAGTACIIMPFCKTYGVLVAACVCYAAGMISAMVLIPIVLSELFGDEMVATSFGICLFFGGVSGLIGTPLAGWIVDITSSYTVSFVIAGVECLIGGAILMILPYVKVKQTLDN